VSPGSSRIRDLACARLAWLGVQIEPATSEADGDVVELTASEATVRVFTVRAREDIEMVQLVTDLADERPEAGSASPVVASSRMATVVVPDPSGGQTPRIHHRGDQG
jgi:hypothetical protein